MKTYFGNICCWSDANLALSMLHALCDIVTDYATETGDDIKVKDSNISFACQIIHDFIVELENEFEKGTFLHDKKKENEK